MDQLLVALTIYSRPGCHLCEEMKGIVERVVGDCGPRPRSKRSISPTTPDLEERYGSEIPVLLVNGKKAAKYRVSERN